MVWTRVSDVEMPHLARVVSRRASHSGVRGFDLEGVLDDYWGPLAYTTDDVSDVAVFYGHDLVLSDCPSCGFRPAKVENGMYFVGRGAYLSPWVP
jgi:hypothetical protein